MSNMSIVITEKQIVDAMDEMCCESLCPEYYDAWEKIVTCLKDTRPALANYPHEIFPGTSEALNNLVPNATELTGDA